ncbi:TPA: hypothetical protein U2B30_001860 [Streptococcus suis]|nr:hypothetical protein [Streptococcus suis]
MAYIVTRNILDSKDNNRLYEAGETYPRPDFTVSDSRIKALLDKGVIVSDEAVEEAKPKRRKKAEETEGE